MFVFCAECSEDKNSFLGATFSIFGTERGTAMFCGNKKFGGDGERQGDNLKPVLIDALLRCFEFVSPHCLKIRTLRMSVP